MRSGSSSATALMFRAWASASIRICSNLSWMPCRCLSIWPSIAPMPTYLPSVLAHPAVAAHTANKASSVLNDLASIEPTRHRTPAGSPSPRRSSRHWRNRPRCSTAISPAARSTLWTRASVPGWWRRPPQAFPTGTTWCCPPASCPRRGCPGNGKPCWPPTRRRATARWALTWRFCGRRRRRTIWGGCPTPTGKLSTRGLWSARGPPTGQIGHVTSHVPRTFMPAARYALSIRRICFTASSASVQSFSPVRKARTKASSWKS